MKYGVGKVKRLRHGRLSTNESLCSGSGIVCTSKLSRLDLRPYQANLLKPNDAYICRTAPLTSRRGILYIYSTHISTAYFKHAANSPFFLLQNAVYFIIIHCLVPILFAFYIQGVLKFKCKIHAPKG